MKYTLPYKIISGALLKSILLILIALFFNTQNNIIEAQAFSGNKRQAAIQMIQEGDLHLRYGQLMEAEFDYTTAINTDIYFADGYMKRALLYRIMGRYSEAEKDYQKAISTNRYTDYIFDEKSKFRLLATDYKGAVNDIQLLVSMIPQDKVQEANADLEYFMAIDAYKKALEYLDSLPEKDHFEDIHFEKQAIEHLIEGDKSGCISNIDSALYYDSCSAVANDLRGILYLYDKNFNLAIEYFTTAIECNPIYYMAYYNRALAFRYMNEPRKALDDYNKAIEMTHDKEQVYFARALVKKESGDMQGAQNDYDKAIEIDKSFTDALYNRVFVNKFTGDYLSALEDAEKVVELEPEEPGNWNMLGNVLLLHGEYDQSISAFTEAVNLDMNYAESYHNRGLSYLMSYRLVEGCRDLQQSIDLGYQPSSKIFSGFCGN